MLGWLQEHWRRWWNKNLYPDDPAERRRIKAFILGAGCVPRPEADGKIHIRLEENKMTKE